ncbi:mevalonate kinase isoform X2 [Diachasma alloeum]|uniref:mevalonate kinase isoform X2 n=1 Tax=Diachasma alloeum TaxID=454923 RepID=UPI0007383330|nr:mevalonate kinase isoform X2 [Diachasma alloeum]
MEFRVSAPGKIVLYGEHAVVYGKTAVAASLDLRTTLEFKEIEDQIVGLSMPKVRLQVNIPNYVEKIGYTNLQQKLALEAFFYLLIAISQVEGLSVRPFRIAIDSALAISSGLGSSASFAVCIATCFLHLSNAQKNELSSLDANELEKISRFAFSCEKIMHGTPSGIDNSVCTYGSIIEFRRGETLEPILGAMQMRVLLVDTRVQRSTKAQVDKLEALKRRYPSIFGPVIEAIDNVSKEALEVIKTVRSLPGDGGEGLHSSYQQLMTLMEVNQGLLATCQTSHPSLDRICAEAKNYGLAAKLTGAGGGGYAYILLLPDTPTETITSISKKLIANGYLVTLTNLGGAGVELHTL